MADWYSEDREAMNELHFWSHPESYAGYQPDGHIVVLTKHRDSDALTRSNWDAGMAALAEVLGAPIEYAISASPHGYDDDPEAQPAAYYWEASHWAVGWVAYLMVNPKAAKGEACQAVAQDLADKLEDYPALDEDAWSALEWDEACETWESMSVRDRAAAIKRSDCGASLFAARRASMPEHDDGSLMQYLNG